MPHSSIPGPREQTIPAGENLFKASLLIGVLAVSFVLANAFPHWLLVSGLAIVNVMLLTGLGVLAHDAVHRVLFRSPFWNEFWGGLLSALALIPFQANRNVHLSHHGHAHQPGLDPEEGMHAYPFWIAVVVGAPMGLAINYRQVFANLANGKRWRFGQDVLFIGGALALYFLALPAMGVSLAATVVPVLIAFPFVFAFRALSDHYGLPASQDITGWVVLTPRWLEWLWSHVNYHEVHHKYPYLAHSYLPRVFAATRDKHPYAVVDGYWRSLWNSRNRAYYAR